MDDQDEERIFDGEGCGRTSIKALKRTFTISAVSISFSSLLGQIGSEFDSALKRPTNFARL